MPDTYPFFCVGETVRVNCDWDSRHGQEGTVIKIQEARKPYGTGLYSVRFPEDHIADYDGTELEAVPENFSEKT